MKLLSSKAMAALAVAMVASSMALGWQANKTKKSQGYTTNVLTSEIDTIQDGQDPKENDLDPVPYVMDKLFDKWFDQIAFVASTTEQDASMLADVALQLSEGERVLFRNHYSGISSSKLLVLSAQMAGKNADRKTLDRLGQVAEQKKNTELAKTVELSRALMAKSRAPITADISNVSPGDFAKFKEYSKIIALADFLQDRTQLEKLKVDIANASLPISLTKALASDLEMATVALREGEQQNDPQNIAIKNLLSNYDASSRDSNERQRIDEVKNGGWRFFQLRKIDMAEYASIISDIVFPPKAASRFAREINALLGVAKQLENNITIADISNALGNRLITKGRVAIKGGLLTYNCWKYIYIFGKKIQIPLPNEHIVYICIR